MEPVGKARVHLVFCELTVRLDCERDNRPLTCWRTRGNSCYPEVHMAVA